MTMGQYSRWPLDVVTLREGLTFCISANCSKNRIWWATDRQLLARPRWQPDKDQLSSLPGPAKPYRQKGNRRGARPVRIVVTGGAGFIGSAVCRYLVRETQASVINVDKLTYAANLHSLEAIANSPRYTFLK